MRKIVLILMSALVAACAAFGEPGERDRRQEIAVYQRHAGGAESWVRFISIRNWWSVGIHSVVLEMDRSRHYLVDLVGACDINLSSAVTLRLVTRRRNMLSEFDDVVVGGHACQIRSIRRLDFEAVEAELAERDEALPEGRDSLEVEVEDQSAGGT